MDVEIVFGAVLGTLVGILMFMVVATAVASRYVKREEAKKPSVSTKPDAPSELWRIKRKGQRHRPATDSTKFQQLYYQLAYKIGLDSMAAGSTITLSFENCMILDEYLRDISYLLDKALDDTGDAQSAK